MSSPRLAVALAIPLGAAGAHATNVLGEMGLASPAADASGLYLRTMTKLYRLQAPASRP